jgi:hypothetical protein
VFFYFPDARFISHAPGGNTVFIPLWRIRDDQAPWLHEVMHILLWPADGDWLSAPEHVANERMPLWLSEGLADVLAIDVSEQEGLTYYSPTSDLPPSALDAECRRRLSTRVAGSILPVIGGRGRIPELFGEERRDYAPAFYNCSASFVAYIRERFGYEPLLAAIAAFDRETEVLEAGINMPLARVREDWLSQVHAAH